ncbi:S1/P1 nuclease [Neolewinella xylanilytica]|uniref:S1/P1 nuclease n=2 Tax=Neolewinella xylanilytica TaxID=1514080 RepID=A0A2S6I783_9BACT|nr:S1/P1 nuclease [Neolewinella xylanilytica]
MCYLCAMIRILLVLLCCYLPQFLSAWGANGHRIVAHIAYENLNDAARARVDAALGDNYLSQVSTWPDYIRAESGWDFASPWHYMTVQPDQTVADVVNETAQDPGIFDVQEAIAFMADVLAGKEEVRQRLTELLEKNKVEPLAGSLDATALAFLIHFVADVHMPLHVGKNRDLGANRITVLFFGDRYNLHSVWDTQIIEAERLSFTEFADYVTMHTRARQAEWADDDAQTWMEESVVLRERIYNTLYDRTDRESGLPDLGYDYTHDFLPVVEERLGAAGYRAAALLNRVLG